MHDGTLRVRLMGRVYEAPNDEALFGAVCRERDNLIRGVSHLHENVTSRQYVGMARIGSGEIYQRDLQRLEDRLAAYNEFLGHLVARMQRGDRPRHQLQPPPGALARA
ncbi:MAG: hypothetical protein U0531_19095 [Dehalococcoidia bacterium]